MIINIKKQRANKDYICGLSGKKINKRDVYTLETNPYI